MMRSIASMKVTSEPNAVYTSANSRPMYPEPMIATQSGTHSSLRASSEVNTVLPSTSMPGGTNGTEPVAMMMSLAVTTRPESPHFTFWPSAITQPVSSMRSTPRFSRDLTRLTFTRDARSFAWSASFARSYSTTPFTLMPSCWRWWSSRISRTRPEAARSALDGTHPRFTHVPPASLPVKTTVLRPLDRAWSAAPWPPTPQPMIARS
mmetsp:Transcript_18201/g.60884  ORF Transcript_18201/g.60884 Transcript_18201/m.60884 type:complete len:207 (+) Transcript_18201:1182-1802(+)